MTRCAPHGRTTLSAQSTALLETVRRGRCPRSEAKRNKYPWGASPRRFRIIFRADRAVRPYTRSDVPCERPLPLPLGEVAERSEDGEGKPLPYRPSQSPAVTALPKGEPRVCAPLLYRRIPRRREAVRPYNRLLYPRLAFALSFRASDRCHWRGNPCPAPAGAELPSPPSARRPSAHTGLCGEA